MLDLTYHILTNETAVTDIVPTARIYADERVQTDALPGIIMEWIATDEEYPIGGAPCVSYYTYDIIAYSKNMAEAHTLSRAIKNAFDLYNGQVTTSAGNTYTVVACEITDRHIETLRDLDTIEITVSIEITVNE